MPKYLFKFERQISFHGNLIFEAGSEDEAEALAKDMAEHMGTTHPYEVTFTTSSPYDIEWAPNDDDTYVIQLMEE